MSTTWGGTTLADPVTPMRVYDLTPVTQKRTADGTLITQTVSTSKLAWDAEWKDITESQRNAIYAKYSAMAAALWSPPNTASTYTVHPRAQSWNEEIVDQASAVGITYNVKLTVEQA